MAEQSIDTLQIEINASAKSSKAEINELCKSLTKLRGELSAIGKIGSFSLTSLKGLGTIAKGVASGIKNLDATIKGTKKSTHSLLGTMGKLYATFWALKKAFGWIGDSMKYASQLTEVQNVVRNAFGPESEKMVNDFAGSVAMLKFGMNELTTKEIASRFQAMGKTLGITNAQMKETQKTVNGLPDSYNNASESVADMSLNLTKLAADMGSFYNKEASEVAQGLQAVFTGQTRPLMLAA